MTSQNESEDEDDYTSMVIAEPKTQKYESSIQRRSRLKREAEQRAHTKSKAERAAAEAESRESALQTPLDSTSRGYKLLSKLGYTPGTGLGTVDSSGQSSSSARLEPIGVEVKSDRAGVGHGDSQKDQQQQRKKRKLSFGTDSSVKSSKLGDEDFRLRMARDGEAQRNERLWWNAMSVLESLEEKENDNQDLDRAADAEEASSSDGPPAPAPSSSLRSTALSGINLLYRSLIKKRRAVHGDRLRAGPGPATPLVAGQAIKIGGDIHHETLYYEAIIDDDDDDDGDGDGDGDGHGENDKKEDAGIAANANVNVNVSGDGGGDGDAELAEFEALEPSVRLQKVVDYLRAKHHYCFWCKQAYDTADMDGCPGLLEDDHG